MRALVICWLFLACSVFGQERGSIVEDRAARKLLEAGQVRYDADELEKAVEVWQSVLERYPRSKVRFQAHLKLGEYYLNKKSEFDRARTHFESAAVIENRDQEQRAEATLKMGVCFYEGRHYGKCFKVMREVIEEFPVSEKVNEAYYYIGLGHFKLGHYSRAIQALEKVGTAFGSKDKRVEKVEAGKRLYVKIEDTDLAVLDLEEEVKITCTTKFKDSETISCIPVGRNVRVVLGSIPTRLGRPQPNNGILEVQGGDVIDVTYVDEHTADKKFNVQRLKQVVVVGNASIEITDGAYQDELRGVVLGKYVNVQIRDADLDISGATDKLNAVVEVYREKSQDELDDELAELVAKGNIPEDRLDEDGNPIIDRYKLIDAVNMTMVEADLREEKTEEVPVENTPPDPIASADNEVDSALAAEILAAGVDDTVHSGLFRIAIPLDQTDTVKRGDPRLQALASDVVRVTYTDKVNITADPIVVKKQAKCIEGNLGGVRVTRAEIQDEELRLRTRLKTADALTHIGNHYKEFGLDEKATVKYDEALKVCESIAEQSRQLGGKILEETYVQLWRIYFAMGNLRLAMATSQRLQREFPNSSFVDEAVLQQARVEQEQGNLGAAISLFQALMKLEQSSLRGEGQYGIAECYEQMATAAPADKAEPLFERAFEEYKKVFDEFPESGRVGDAVAKMANFYYQKKDYNRAVDVFENVLSDYPDANFLDVILFNYGRCLYRLDRKAQARKQFDQLLNDFPDSKLAQEAKKISQALASTGT